MSSAKERALSYIRQTARIKLHDLRPNIGAKTRPRQLTSTQNRAGKSMKELQQTARPPLGWIWGDFYKPWMRRFPADPNFNKDIHLRREYPRLSLIELQRLIDLGWIDVSRPIDLAALCSTGRFKCDPLMRQFGVHLTDEVASFRMFYMMIQRKMIYWTEVQRASELAIATIERLGGRIITAYFDPSSLTALVNPKKFFERGEPIPRRAYPPADLIEYYADPQNRGYLAPDRGVAWHQKELAQKYGYEFEERPRCANNMRKAPLQIFYGLQAGWLVNLPDKTILKPVEEKLADYYRDDK